MRKYPARGFVASIDPRAATGTTESNTEHKGLQSGCAEPTSIFHIPYSIVHST